MTQCSNIASNNNNNDNNNNNIQASLDGLNCYVSYLFSIGFNQSEAANLCQQNNGYLPSIHSYDQSNSLISIISSGQYAWIGLGYWNSNQIQNHNLTWMDGSNIDFTNFQNSQGPNEDPYPCYSVYAGSSSWTSFICSDPLTTVVCQYPLNQGFVYY